MANCNVFSKDHGGQVRCASSANGILGVWLILAAWLYAHAPVSSDIVWNDSFVGLLIATFGFIRYQAPQARIALSWANAILGVWSIATLWIFAYTGEMAVLWNTVAIGGVVLCLALWSAAATLTEHGRRSVSHRSA